LSGALSQTPLGSLQHSQSPTDPLAGIKGPFLRGRREGRGEIGEAEKWEGE